MRSTVKLGEICQIRTGKKDANYGTDDGQYAFFTCGKEILKAPDYSFDTEAILIAGNGDVGDCKYYKGKFEAYQRTYVLDDFDERIDIHYAFHLLSGKLKGHVLKQIKGSAIPYIKLGALQNFEIPLPPLETQKVIVAKLDQIFAELDQTKSEIQKNLDNTDELRKSALNQAFQGDWEMKKLGEVCEVIAGQSPESDYYNESGEGLPFFQGKTEFTEKYLGEPKKWTTKTTKESLKNDILMSVRAPVGPVNINGFEKICIGRGLCAIRPGNNVKLDYVFDYLLGIQDKISGNRGSVFDSINRNQIESIELPVPPLSEQEKIVEHLDQVSKEVKALKSQYQSQLDNLEELKKSVLDKAFRGELGE